MEHTLGELQSSSFRRFSPVLILVLVEHTLGGQRTISLGRSRRSLNPCFSGTYSRSPMRKSGLLDGQCLNPCFSGTYSRSSQIPMKKYGLLVLILVLVEHTLGVKQCTEYRGQVLILVLVEHTLGGPMGAEKLHNGSLNPCFSGTYSRRACKMARQYYCLLS